MMHKHKKPNWIQDIYDAFTHADVQPKAHEICVIGDRIAIDVIMGNTAGFLTIHTVPFWTKNENFLVRLARKFENTVLVKLSNKENNSKFNLTQSIAVSYNHFERLKAFGKYQEIIKSKDIL